MSSLSKGGFTLLEVVIATFIIGTVVVGMFGLFLLTLRGAQTGERRIAAAALANERMEMVRNLPYAEVGTQGGVPGGSIPQTETVVRNGQTYTVRTDIRYFDDAYDGSVSENVEGEEKVTICHQPVSPLQQTLEVSASALDAHIAHGDTTGPCGSQGEGTPPGDQYNADYKKVRVEVSWPSQYLISPVLLITYVAPQGIEGGEEGGTLDFHALDAGGAAVADADMTLVNNAVVPPISLTTQTNAEGRVVLPGLPAASDSYELLVTKEGYTTEQTYATTATFIPAADYSHMSVLVKQVTQKTFFIDKVATLSLTAVDENNVILPNMAYRLRGTKSIGTDEAGQIVYKVDEVGTTNAAGPGTHEDLEWDTYDITVDGQVTGYDIKETSVVLPLAILPDQVLEVTAKLVPHTDNSLHVTVVGVDGNPVDNATVHVIGSGLDETQVTGVVGQVFFADLSPGVWQVEVEAPGFTPSGQTVDVAGTKRIRVELAPAP